MRYSSTLIGIGMRYSLISMAVFKPGLPLTLCVCVCVCVCAGVCSSRPIPLPEQHIQRARRGEWSVFSPEDRQTDRQRDETLSWRRQTRSGLGRMFYAPLARRCHVCPQIKAAPSFPLPSWALPQIYYKVIHWPSNNSEIPRQPKSQLQLHTHKHTCTHMWTGANDPAKLRSTQPLNPTELPHPAGAAYAWGQHALHFSPPRLSLLPLRTHNSRKMPHVHRRVGFPRRAGERAEVRPFGCNTPDSPGIRFPERLFKIKTRSMKLIWKKSN